MKQEKMMELWRKEFENSYYQWGLTSLVYDYLEEKTDELNGPLTSGQRKYYTYYHDWMIKELDGENHELARRMLVAISKMRNGGLISGSYRIREEANICLRIGYDFDSIIKQTIHKFNDISEDTLYWLAGALLQYHPEESIAFANQLLTDKLGELLDKRKMNRELYLALYIAAQLLNKDASAYAQYIHVLALVAKRIKNDITTVMLYHTYESSPELRELLLDQLDTNFKAAFILYKQMTKEEYIPFLEKVGAPLWSYYYLLATDNFIDLDKASILKQLYKENKDIFMDLFGRMATSKDHKNLIEAAYLLAILLQNGEGQEELENYNIVQLALFNDLNQKSIEKIYYDEEVDLKDVPPLPTTLSLGWGTWYKIVGVYCVLYDYSSRARRLMHVLLTKQPKTSNSYENDIFATGYFLRDRKKWLSIEPKDSLKVLFDSGCITIDKAFRAYCYTQIWGGQIRQAISEAITCDFILENKEAALDTLSKNDMSVAENLVWAELLYQEFKLDATDPLFAMLTNKSKLIRKKAEEIIKENEATIRPIMEEKMGKLRGNAQDAAKRLIKCWDNERKFGANFSFKDNAAVIEYCNDNHDKGNDKFISWIPEDMLTEVRFIDLTEKAPVIVIKHILAEYMALEEAYRIKACDKIVERLNPQDFQATLENIYQLWKDNGAEAKKKMFMVPYCLYVSDSQILRLKTQLKDWAEASRGAVAAFVVNAIAMNGGSVALMMIDGISVKFPNNQVKNAAKTAFVFAAKALEIPEDELSDKIVPTLGFNKEGEKELDYGARTFKITLMPDFTLTIYDNDKQKNIKSMPAPGANDDTVKATAAKKEFSELKKQMKVAVQTQTNRLEKVLMNGRRWTVNAWSTLFVENPIMHRFATGLIWGVYEGDKLIETFRYMDDGTFNTVDEDEFTLPENASITLVHPIEMSAELVAQWKEQLDDYEVVQPLPQLSAPMVTIDPKDIDDKKVIKYIGCMVKSGKIAGIAKKYNMARGEVWDGGSYTCFHWVDKYLNLAAQINFEYMWMGQEYNDDVTLGNLIFYRLGEEQEVEEEPKANMILDPSAVPARFVSSVIGIFDTLKEE
ncbi:DUF4132 domain-containing protein [Bacteroides sp. 519]|uniref:DUF4132 domain-containing protein n=1 Tax=Bacteroides sp. 519 TaxID=2302937 RepID=UPI0013D71333|nr:DUF4132 domain-containing protein [Bacteroides sp. 519]NDV58872.1 DUF4132 domain-containing protein [Bacteroides sp. 519]